jgi:hypothetical protein
VLYILSDIQVISTSLNCTPQDKAILEAALQRAMTDDQRIAAAAAAAAGRATLQGQSTMLRASGVRSPDLR